MPFHNRTERFAVGVAHRRCGKTVAAVNDKIRRAVLSDKKAYEAAYVAPFLKQAKKVAWEYLKEFSRPLWTKPPNESELYVSILRDAKIRIFGADNADSLRGSYLDDCTLDEYADMAPSIWGSVIRPMLSDRRGTATFIGTPKGRNQFFDIYQRAEHDPEWTRFFLPASKTGILPQSELDSAKLDMTPEQYEQEFECSFEAAIIGAYYGKEISEADRQGRITAVEYDPDLPVYTAWDLGMGDSTAIWFWQVLRDEIRVLDYYENHGQGLDHYAKVIHSKPYRVTADYVPHDARVRELGTGRSRVETMVSLGLKPKLAPSHGLMDGINATRVTLPRIWFDEVGTRDGVEALRQYRSEYDEKTRAFKDTPRHDWTSHAADAFRYLCMAWRELAPDPKPKPRGRTIHEMTLNEAWDLLPQQTGTRI
jgi:hypothetical protein